MAKRINIDNSYLVPVKSNFDGELIFVGGGYEEPWYSVGEVLTLPWEEIKDMRKYKRCNFENNWVVFEPTDEYSVAEMYEALGVSQCYPDANKFKSLDEVLAMKPAAMAKYLQEVSENYRESIATYAKGLYLSKDKRMDSNAKREAIEKVLGVDFNEV